MSVVAAIREMLAKGLTVEQALTAAEIMEGREESQLEARKANDRERKARQRRLSREVTGGHVSPVTSPSPSLAKERSPPIPPSKENSTLPLPLIIDSNESIVPDVTGTCNINDLAERKKQRFELFQAVVGMWNELASSYRLVSVRDITQPRQAAIIARSDDLVKTYDFPDAISGWREIMGRVRGSPFLRGEANGFRCDFDFVTRARSFTKIMEGKYEAADTIHR